MKAQKILSLTVKDQDVSSPKNILQHLLPLGYKLELYEGTRTISVLRVDSLSILRQQQFTRNEWSIFHTLLSHYPHYAPHEALLASVTLLSISDCRQHLQKIQMLGPKALKSELKPIYRALAGIKRKLDYLTPHLQIALVRNLDYMLTTLAG